MLRLSFLLSALVFQFDSLAQTAQPVSTDQQSYTQLITGSTQLYPMMAIPGGEFLMGSPATEKGRSPDEGPQHKVKIEPFWMGKFEVTWDIYDLFTTKNIEKEMAVRYPDGADLSKTDASTRPSPSYVDMSFGMGREGYPAINMTHYAAIKFCAWLYDKTGLFYRLPTEAEWEYACRANAKTPFSFGADLKLLSQYAVYKGNSEGTYKKIGTKKPNAWGLHDMHGNVMEWTKDQYIPTYYAQKAGGKVVEPFAPTTQLYPNTTRGGSWDDDALALRSAARVGSNSSWKVLDPQSPKSDWWMTSASFLGFRVVRPVKTPTPEEIRAYYDIKAIKDFGF